MLWSLLWSYHYVDADRRYDLLKLKSGVCGKEGRKEGYLV